MQSADGATSTKRRETADQRARRLARQREYNQRRRRAHTSTQAESSGNDSVAVETEAQYRERLSHQREYAKRRRDELSSARDLDPECEEQQRFSRQREYQREYTQRKRAGEGATNPVRLTRKTAVERQRALSEGKSPDDGEASIDASTNLDERNQTDLETTRSAGQQSSRRANQVLPSVLLPVESEARYQRRLAYQREYSRNRRVERSSGQLAAESGTRPSATVEDLLLHEYDLSSRPMPSLTEDLNTPVSLSPVSPELVDIIEGRLQAALGAEGLDECVCAVCDRLVLRKNIQHIRINDQNLFGTVRRVLQPPIGLPQLLLEHYNCGGIDASLGGVMLSRIGVTTHGTHIGLNACEECHSNLVKGGDKPPKYAIANGFYVGLLPEHLFMSTWIEKVMTQLVTVVAQTRVMRGGRHRAIRSHCMVFDATPGPPATLLPRRIDRDGPYRVVLAGPMTATQTDRIRKLHHARGSMVSELLNFFKSHNCMYRDVSVDDSAVAGLDSDASMCDRIFIDIDDPEAAAAVDAEQESVGGHHDGISGVEAEAECSLIERNVLLADEGTVNNSAFVQQRVVDLNQHEPSATPHIRVDHSSRFATNVDIEAKMYPHLFPFGRGHPNEPRPTPVSKRDCIRYYAMLSSRRFAQDPTFLLTAFSRLSLENMYMLTAVKCRRYGSLFEGYEAISRNDLMAALVNNERRHRGEQRQELPNPTAERFLKSVELGSVSVWGSSAERRQCRQEAFAYQTRFGQPALFVTLTPNTDNSYAMAHYTGILSVDTLFDSLEARVPTPVEMKKAAMMDDCASARLFMRNVDAFITHVLGIDPKTQCASPEGGRFGRTKAYYGMVETQGRGTLHIHFLIWLFGAPVNSSGFEESVTDQGPAFVEGLEAYADSIVTTELPLPMEQAQCYKCQTSGKFLPLPIPSRARRSTSKRDVKDQFEPLLVKCEACGLESSAQHLIRNVLVEHRPPHWPPPLTPLSEQAFVAEVSREVRARSSEDEALAVIERRELFHAAVEPGPSDEIAEWMIRVSDSSQQGYMHADEDPSKIDPMYRFIEMTPPTLNRTRMSPEHYAYMLASLVVNLNMHAWTHTTSCFKASRATSSACVCRYGFPRDRAVNSSLSGPSVTMKRSLGHEYINGYNATIMAMFKCNHDVQILFGGKDAINRIYYCCKYVTKPQRQIDSATAVALANFQRRQAKEAVELASETPPPIRDVQRRRVTGMVHTFTNKQEIAGPLAVLYILRGSCSYASENCVKLPLSDILKQIESSGDYVCSLVKNQQAVYTSTSSLDDYIFRPQSTSSLNVYEFFMRCYRRQITSLAGATHRFTDRHPLSDSHCLAFRRKGAVPVIKGPRLMRYKEGMSRNDLEAFAKIALVLFKPFRGLSDLLSVYEHEDKPWYTAYCEWEESRSEFTAMIMKNMNDYYAGREAENEAILQGGDERDESAADRSDSDSDSTDDAYLSDDNFDVDDAVDTADVLDLLAQTSTRPSDDILRAFPSPAGFPSRIQLVLQALTNHDLVGTIASSCVNTNRPRVAIHQGAEALRKWVESPSSDASEDRPLHATQSASNQVFERPTTVTEMFQTALGSEQRRWDPTAPVPQEAPIFCGISVISRLFTLNELQHGAFAIVATHLLRRWQPSSDPTGPVISDEELDHRQLRMYIGGEGGTGKSRVIQAIQELCRCWQRPKSTIVCAMTGKAATLINGRTLASFEVSLKGPSSHVDLQDVDCIIVDEVSMMSKDQLLRLSRALNKAKRMSFKDAKFGGIHTILVGDFFQLPPVGADPLFIDPESKTKKVTMVDFDGFDLWRKFDMVVVLRKSERFKSDPEWGEGCSRARYGDWTPAFVQMINSQVVPHEADEPSSQSALISPPSGTVFVSPDNDARTAINGHFIARTANLLSSGELPIRVVANFKGALNNLSADDVNFIMGLSDNRFGRMAPYLDLIRGMPIQVTQNIRTQKGVANGTMGFLEHVEFPSDTAFRRALDKRTGAIVLLPDRRPSFALLRLNRSIHSKPLGEGVDAALFPVFPDAEPFKKSDIKLTPSASGQDRVLSIKIQQFPFVCAVGATVYKVQGESLKSMVVVDWKAEVRGVNKSQQAYLMVSRVTQRDGLVCLKPLTQDVMNWARPSKETLQEDRRLAAASDHTLARFYAGEDRRR